MLPTAAVHPHVDGTAAHRQAQIVSPSVAREICEPDDVTVGVDPVRDGLGDGIPDPPGAARASVTVHGHGPVQGIDHKVVCLAVAVDVGEDDILAARTNTVGDGSLRNPLV
jgi:hypothetical protein